MVGGAYHSLCAIFWIVTGTCFSRGRLFIVVGPTTVSRVAERFDYRGWISRQKSTTLSSGVRYRRHGTAFAYGREMSVVELVTVVEDNTVWHCEATARVKTHHQPRSPGKAVRAGEIRMSVCCCMSRMNRKCIDMAR